MGARGYTARSMRERLIERFVVTPEGCWRFLGRHVKGYGQLTETVAPGVYRTVLAHRAAYETYVGPIPEGLFVCHACDVRDCCNPKHLWLGTNSENMRDMSAKGRATKRTVYRVACRYGHARNEENVRYSAKGAAICRVCRREREVMNRALRCDAT